MKLRILVTVALLMICKTMFALSIGQKEINMFNNEVVKCAKDVFSYKGENVGDSYLIKIDKRKIRDIVIDAAAIKCYGLSEEKKKEFSQGNITYDELRDNVSLAVAVSISESALQDYINIAINRGTKSKRKFDDVTIKLKNGKAYLKGKINMKNMKLPSFMSSDEIWNFDAEVSADIQDSKIYIQAHKVDFNGSSHPVLLSAIMAWLNPVWDFSELPDKASIDIFEIFDGKIRAFGKLFR